MKKAIILLLFLGIVTPSFASTWIQMDCGTEFTLALKSDGTLWAWGFNGNGQLGIGSNTLQNIPTQIGTDTDWVTIAAGAIHGLAIKSNGTLWAWGGNGANQLGNGNTTDVNAPIQIGTDTDWETIEAGQGHSFAIKTNHTLWGWGFNNVGQVGDGTTANVASPVQIGTDTDWKIISTGGAHTMALKMDSTLWVWGSSANGELGLGNTNSHSTPMQNGTHTDWIEISAGFQFSMGLRQGGTLWTWGFNGNDQLGDDGLGIVRTTPAAIEPSIQWKKIAAGASFAYAIKADGSLYSWGYNGYGQLGQGHTNGVSSPTQVGAQTDWVDVKGADGLFANNSVVGLHGLAIKSPRTVICAAGFNTTGQLGNGSTQHRNIFDCSTGNQAVGIADRTLDAPILVYPNPSTGRVHLTFHENQKEVQLELVNTSGQQVFKQSMQGPYAAFDWSKLAKGVYFLKIRQNDQYDVQRILLN